MAKLKAIPILTVAEAAYLAAFLDGEGSIGLNHGSPDRPWKMVRLSFANTDKDILDYIGSLLQANVHKSSKYPTSGGKSYWYLYVANHFARGILEQVRPYMHHSGKVARTDLILNEYAALLHQGRLTPDIAAKRKDLERRVSDIHTNLRK